MNDLRINGKRLWQSLMDLAQIGATPKGGVKRLTLTEEDRRARDLFCRWAREAGLAVEVDGIGNLFARRAGTDPSLPPVAMGSHLDSQPSGGKFDGAYGVMAGLEVLRTLNRRWRGIDRATDVLSFGYDEAPQPAGPVVHGDLVVSMERMEEQARRYRVTRGAELARLVIHGTLHLAGFDHHRAADRLVMRAAEEKALRAGRAAVKALDRVLAMNRDNAGASPARGAVKRRSAGTSRSLEARR